jgi:ferredoxin-NADP reductase
LHKPLRVRVGGAFIYPPPALSFEECKSIERAVFVAGGVGVNPVMSMLSAMHGLGPGRVGGMVGCVRVLYTARKRIGEEVLFYKRIRGIAESYERDGNVDFKFVLHETGGEGMEGVSDADAPVESKRVEHKSRRIEYGDLLDCLGPEEERKKMVVYVCGPPTMTDEFVDVLGKALGMEDRRVLCEKWW